MRKFAIQEISWLNDFVRNTGLNIKEKIISGYLENQSSQKTPKSTDINVLLNRVKLDQKKEQKKNTVFNIATAGVCICFINILK